MKGKSSTPRLTLGAAVRGVCLLTAVLALVACGGGSKSTTSSSYTVGGTIAGLNSGSVVLIYNDSTTLTVASGATTWVFPSPFPAGVSFAVTVLSNPIGELCEVTSGGSGTALTANVTDVSVVCTDFGQWTWEAGLDTVNGSGVSGTLGATAASNLPGSRYDSSSWTDSTGNLWLFGGYGYDAAGSAGYLNDLWRYSPSTGQWVWLGGSNGDNASGIYGTLGTAAAGNMPGARYSASSWIDSAGNLWLFGGVGDDSTGAAGNLNDLWQYTPTTGLWTWVSGGNTANAAGVYGTEGTATAGNLPGARQGASSWIDSAGNLWLFGGYGYGSTTGTGYLNDLWQYSPGTGLWTWISGGNADNASGVYGTEGTTTAGSVPGSRQAASAWADASGNMWLFGGAGYDANGAVGVLNDLWRFAPSSGQWTWVSGSSSDNAGGAYGTQGAVSVSTVPGARQAASSWIDSSGHLWLFGGAGFGSTGNGYLNDLWQFIPP
jgi:N-acetylneuraminic acid mutarotase